MSRIVHFEIPVKDADKVAKFYQEVFGWKTTKWDGPADYWLVETGEEGTVGINGGLYNPEGDVSVVVNTIGVGDLDAMLVKVKANGGSIVGEKMPIPGMGWFAYSKDVEGTLFGMMQPDPTAGTNGDNA